MRQFEQTLGVVENIDTTSRQLKEAVASGKTIIVTTLQKFPAMLEAIRDMARKDAKEGKAPGAAQEVPGRQFAVIVDEAHSSQAGDSPEAIKRVFTAESLERRPGPTWAKRRTTASASGPRRPRAGASRPT